MKSSMSFSRLSRVFSSILEKMRCTHMLVCLNVQDLTFHYVFLSFFHTSVSCVECFFVVVVFLFFFLGFLCLYSLDRTAEE